MRLAALAVRDSEVSEGRGQGWDRLEPLELRVLQAGQGRMAAPEQLARGVSLVNLDWKGLKDL